MVTEAKERQLRYVLRSGISYAHMVFLFAMLLEPTIRSPRPVSVNRPRQAGGGLPTST